MLLSAATDNVTREDYEAPVYHNILDDLASIEVMNAQVHRTLIRLLLGGAAASPGFLGFAANKTGWQDAYAAARLIVFTELCGVKDTPALRAQIVAATQSHYPHDWANLIAPFVKGRAISPITRLGDVIRDLQDEVETLVDELVRVRLPLPKDLRNWARRVEDLSYQAKPNELCPQYSFGGGKCRWVIDPMPAFELGVQTKLMMGWIAQMRSVIHQQIATAGLTGKTGKIDLELTPSQRSRNAAGARATTSLFDPQRGATPVKAAALTPAEQNIAQTIRTKGVAAAIKLYGAAAVSSVLSKLRASPGSSLAPTTASRRAASSSALLWPAAIAGVFLLFTL